MCMSSGTVTRGRCQLCEAVFDEDHDGAVDLPPTAPSAPSPPLLRFTDVIEELQQVGELVSTADGALEIEAACGRLQLLLHSLREQFVSDVVLAENAIAPPGPKRHTG